MITPIRRAMIVCVSITVICSIISLAGIKQAAAHGMPIAILKLKETTPGDFTIRWRFSDNKSSTLLDVIYPEHCEQIDTTLECGNKGLSGRISIEHLSTEFSAIVVRIQPLNNKPRAFTLTSANTSVVIASLGDSSRTATFKLFKTYVVMGFEHILLGVDHLLFVLGLIWLVSSTWTLVKTITAFTIAHSFTLAGATLGWVGAAERPVNAVIALSIVFIGVEIVKYQRGEKGLTVRYPWLVACVFGLLHGFGFSNALTQLGLPENAKLLALLSFNVGVEIGQVAFVLLVLAIAWAHKTMSVHFYPRLQTLPAYIIGTVAMFWFIGRMNDLIFATA